MPDDNRNKNGKHGQKLSYTGENFTVVLLTTGGNTMFLQVPNLSFQGTYIRKTWDSSYSLPLRFFRLDRVFHPKTDFLDFPWKKNCILFHLSVETSNSQLRWSEVVNFLWIPLISGHRQCWWLEILSNRQESGTKLMESQDPVGVFFGTISWSTWWGVWRNRKHGAIQNIYRKSYLKS